VLETINKISGLVAMNSLMAMVGGTLICHGLLVKMTLVLPIMDLWQVLWQFVLVSDLMHPIGALIVGLIAGALFVKVFTLEQNTWKIDDVLGVWPLHGLCGLFGGLAAGIFGTRKFRRTRRYFLYSSTHW
jgi:Amt family ammonium transporter